MVDQNPIGRTTRSNPASYVGAFDAIRALFAAEPAAQERKYTAGTFSFNSGNGRCPTCSGNGFEHVEMQFLSDVYLRCPDCNGRRYREEVLDIRREGADGRRCSIADVLDLTVTEARAFFADVARGGARLAPLADVGLEYLKLGQPVPTLSGGEAQRLKLAGHLAAGRLGALEHHASRQAVPVRRADHRAALRGRREAAAGVPQAAGRRTFAAGDRAQPRRDPRGRLDHRPGARGRRARRRDRLRRHARAGARARRLVHRPGARGLRRSAQRAARWPAPAARAPSRRRTTRASTAAPRTPW